MIRIINNMKIVRNRKDLINYLNNIRINNQVGLVPTMGSIHQGHLSLIDQSVKNKYITCVSIFINPTQFNRISDFKSYPRSEKKDLKLLKKSGCDIVFIPSTKDMYPKKIKIKKIVKKYRNILCDNFRPGHFDGVVTIVNKLLYIFVPDFVFFGEKDYQQLKIIEELIKIKKINTKVVNCKSIRDNLGMSLSSRYNLFNKSQKIKFEKISNIILDFVKKIKNEKKFNIERNLCIKKLKDNGVTKIDYVEIRNNKTMSKSKLTKNSRLFVAFYLDNIRVIDNYLL